MTKVNDQEVARIVFVVNGKHHEQNLQLANNLHERLEEMYPSLSRGVIVKTNYSQGTHSNYNQDLHEHSLLIEMGGLENSMEKVKITADYLC